MKTETKIQKIKSMIENSKNGKVSLKIGSALEKVAFDCACGSHPELDLNRTTITPLSDNAIYSFR